MAIMSGKAFSGFIAIVLNFDILTTTLPHWVIGTLILVSNSLPLIFTVISLTKASRTNVREALTDYGVTQNVKTLAFKASFLPYAVTLAIRNSRRKSSRLLVTVLSMVLGVAIFSTGFNVRQSLSDLLTGFEDSLRYDVQLVLSDSILEEDALAPFINLGNIKQFETWAGGQGAIQSKVLSSTKGVGVVALPWDTQLQKFDVKQGRWLADSTAVEVVMNVKALELYDNAAIGETIELTVGGKEVVAQLVGVIDQLDLPKMYFDLTQHHRLFDNDLKVNTVLFEAVDDRYESVLELKRMIEQSIQSSDLEVLYVVSQAERVEIIYDHLNIILSCLIFLSLLVLIVSAIGMASATSINILERTREIGIMRAIGATPKDIYRIFVSEGMIISSLSIVFGLIVAWPLSKWAAIIFGNLMVGSDTALDYAFSIQGFFITLVCTLLFGWLASRIPAGNAVKIPTYQTLSYE